MFEYTPPYAAAAGLGQSKTTREYLHDSTSESKAARENLHDTTMAVDSIHNSFKAGANFVIDFSPREKATYYFADTICEFSESLTPDELYQCLVDAMESHYQYTKKEFDHATQLRDLITGFKND